MKNILVTGGAGYVGGAVTDLLKENGNYNFRVYDNLLYEDSYLKDVDFVYGDIRDHKNFAKQLEWADAVIHLAAIVGDGACTLDPDLTIAVNQEAVRWLAENFDGRIMFTSTCSVYGAQPNELDEGSAVNPLSLYAGTKIKSEEFLVNKNAISFRLGTLFGVSDKFSRTRMDLVLNYMTSRAFASSEINVFGGDQFRPVLHVKDVARAIIDNLEKPHRGIYNLLNQNIRIIDLAYQIRNHFPDLTVQTTPTPFEDTRNYRVSVRKVREELGFIPRYSLDDGIREIKEALEDRRIKDLGNPRYSNHLFLKEAMFKNNGNGQAPAAAVRPASVSLSEQPPIAPKPTVNIPVNVQNTLEPKPAVEQSAVPVAQPATVPAPQPVVFVQPTPAVSPPRSVSDWPQLLEGGLAVDDRGSLLFANSFDFHDVKRFYLVDNFSLSTIRAWHGHLKEAKYVLVVSGSAIVAATKMSTTVNPDKGSQVHRYVLSARQPSVLRIPAGYANGFRALEPNTKVMFLSTATLEESKGDDYRFPAEYWGESVWSVENR